MEWKDYNKLVGTPVLVRCPVVECVKNGSNGKVYCGLNAHCNDGIITAELASVSAIKRKIHDISQERTGSNGS